MLMLTIETFLLMLLAGIFGWVVGTLLGCRCGPEGIEWSNDQPWLRDARAAPPAPLLSGAPALLSADERARLAAALAASKVAPAPASVAPAPAEPAPVAAVEPVIAPPEPAPVAPEPVPVVAPAAAEPAPTAYALPAEIAALAVAPKVAAEDEARAAAADAVGTRPLALAAPIGGKADDLKRIRGIGPQNERKLHGLGVYHFSQIAAWTAENAKWAGSFMAFPGRIEREDWIAQATVLATGAETEFSKRVDAGEVPTSQSDGKA